jgi:UDP-galactopyranose mutase
LLPVIRPSAVVYDLIDDFCAFSWAPREGRAMEAALVDQTDLAFAGTGFLEEMFRPALPGIEFLPSGVKYQALSRPKPEPDDLAKLPRPRLLFVGTLNDKIDGRLLVRLAREFPDGSIAVVGPRHRTFDAPPMPENVHFLGLKPHGELPGYFQHADLGLMPFADTPAARAINPIKTLEYLATGLPVLSTPIPDVERYYADVVRVARPDEWPAAAREMIENDSENRREERRSFARDRSWNRLVQSMEERLRRLEARLR